MEVVTWPARVPRAALAVTACMLLAVAAGRADAVEPADPSLPVTDGNWQTPVYFGGTLNGEPAELGALALGLHPAATDGFDVRSVPGAPRDMDYVAPPSVIVGSVGDDHEFPNAFFILDDTQEAQANLRELQRDYRGAPADTVLGTTWRLFAYNPTVSAWTLSWDMTGLPDIWSEASITDDSTGVGFSMREAFGVDVPPETSAAYTIRVRLNVNEPPVFDLISDVSVAEDGTATVSITGVDAGAEDEVDQTLTFLVASSNPSVVPDPTLTGDGATRSLDINTVADANGTAEITVDVFDDGLTGDVHSNTSSQTFTVTVFAVNDPPTIDGPLAQVISEDAGPQVVALEGIGVGGGEDEASTQTLTVEAVSDTPDIVPDPMVTDAGSSWELAYEAAADAHTDGGTPVEITVHVTDDGGGDELDVAFTSVSFLVDVLSVNDSPTIEAASELTTTRNVPTSFVVTAADLDGDTLVLDISEPGSGTAAADGFSVTYTPAVGFVGSDSFTVAASDGDLASDAIVVQVSVVNQTPLLEPAVATTPKNTAVEIPLTATDADGDALTFDVTADGGPEHGTVAFEGSSAFYTPDGGYHGADAFQVIADDGDLTSDAAQVDVSVVNAAPALEPASANTPEGVAVEIPLLATDADDDPLTFEIVEGAGPDHGTVVIEGSSALYTPEDAFYGPDAFEVVAFDGIERTDPATVSVTVLSRPVVSVPDDFELSVIQGALLIIPLDIVDPDSESFTGEITDPPTGGVATFAADALSVNYVADATFVGQDGFALTVTDADGVVSEQIGVLVDVRLPNQGPVIAPFEPVITTKNLSAIIIVNATDPDQDELTFEFTAFPTDGTATQEGLVITYTPIPGFVGVDSFSLVARDAEFTSSPVTVQVTVLNQLPLATGATAETVENTPVQIPLSASDADGDEVTFVVVTAPTGGEVFIEGASATYTPAVGFADVDTFEIAAFDGTAQGEPVAVVVTVLPVNDPPTLSLDPTAELSAIPGEALVIPLLIEDPDSEVFTIEVVQGAAQGSVEPGAGGFSVVYTPSVDAEGDDGFTIRALDDAPEPAASDELPIAINIVILDQTPVVGDVGPLSGPKNTVIEAPLAGNDPNDDPLTFEVTRAPENGAVAIDGSSAFYAPAEGFSGEDSFAYVASDGENTSAPGEVSLIVENAAPIADAITAAGVEDEPVVVTLTGSDADGDALTFTLAEPPRRGDVTLDDSTATYTPRADFSGTDEFSFTVTDGDVVSEPGVVAIDVEAFDDPPTLNTDRSLADIRATEGDLPRTLNLGDPTPLFVDPDSPITIAAGTSDFDVVETFLTGTSLTLTFATPGIATVAVSAQGSEEVASFQVEVVALELRNDPPELQPLGSPTAVEGDELTITPSASDPDEDALTWSLVSVERFGTASADDTEPVVAVDPDTGVTTFSVENITGLQAKFGVEISVADEINEPVLGSTLILVTSSNEPPVVTAPGEIVAEVDEFITFDVAVTDPDGDEVAITASVREREGDIISASQSAVRSFNRADVALDADTSIKTFTFTPTDSVSGRIVTLQWVADDGQASATGSTQIQVGQDVNLPPTVETIDDIEVEEGGRIEVAVVAEDPDGAAEDTLVVVATGLPTGAAFDSVARTITWEDIGFDRSGSYTLTVTATDVGGLEAAQTFRVRVTDVNREPEVTGSSSTTPDGVPGSISLQRLTVLTLEFAASDPDGDNVTLTVRGVPGWARVKQSGSPTAPRVSIELEPARDAEDFTASITATDSGGLTADVAVAIVLEAPPNTDPKIEDIAPLTVVEEETAEFTVDASDEDGDDLTVTAANVPEGATFDGATFIWTPERGQSQEDPYSIALTVDDGNGGQAEATAQVTVLQAANRNPEIATIADVTVVEGETVSVTAAVTDLDGDETQLEVQTGFLASNLSVDQASGEITFVTEAGVDGAGEGFYSVTLLATDTREGETAVTFLLTVEPEQASGVQELAIRAALVSPKVGTAEDVFSFGAVVTTTGGDPDSVTIAVVSDAGSTQESAMGSVGAAAATGARYGVDLTLAPGAYTFTVIASAGGETTTRDEDGPVVEEALIDISNLVTSGSTEDISVQFDLTNPNPGQTVTLGVEFRDADSEAWLPASASGSINALRNGSHAFTWHSADDVPDALGETYVLRLTAGASGERISSGFRVVNALPTAPTLDELAPSAEASLVVTGSSEIIGADIDVILDDQNVGSTQVEADGTFRFVTAELQPGAYEVRATASILGVASVRSAPVEVVVDSSPPILDVVSPERGSEVPTLEPVISFRVDFGLSGGDPSDVAVALNGKPAEVTFDTTSELYSVRETLFDQRLYLASVRAAKLNGLTLSDGWAFTVNLAAGDEIAPTAVTFEPTGSINDASPTVKVVVSDGETGIDTESVEVLLNGVPIATTYSPKDENSGSAAGVPVDPLVDGDYTASATFTDLAGNDGEAEWSFAVDTTPPAAPTFTTPAPGEPAITSDNTFTVQGAAEAESEVVVVIGGTVVGTATPGADGAWALSVDLGAGATEVQAQARDTLENVSELSDTVSIVLDAEAPQITLATPALEAATPNLQPTFSGSVTDALSGIDPASVTLEIDSAPVGVTFDVAAGTFTYDAAAPFESGSTIAVRIAATDGAGNPAEINGSVTFDAALSDITAPSILNPQINGIGLVAGSATLIQTSDATIQFAVTDDLSGVERVFGTLDGGEVEFAVADTSATLALSGLTEGSHVLLVSAADVAGNTGEPQQYDFVLDVGTTPPVLTAPALTNAPDIVVQGSGIEDGATVSVLVNGVPVETTAQGVAFQTGVVSLQEGDNTVTATATDAVGNTADGEPIIVTLDSTPPELAFLAPLSDSTVNADTDTVIIRASDVGGIDPTRVDFTIDGVTVTPSVDADGTITYVAGAPFEASGTDEPLSHFASIVVGDVAGNTSRLGAQFFVDGTPPAVQGFIPAKDEIVPSLEPAISATIVATDLDLNSVAVFVGPVDNPGIPIVGDANYEFDPGTGQFSYFPLLEDKTTYLVTVSAADKVGNTVVSAWAFAIDTEAEDTNEPSTTILFPKPGENINEVGLDILSFAVGDAAGIGNVTMFVNDPTGSSPLGIGQLEDEGIAQFNRKTGVIRIFGRRLLRPRQGSRGGFSFDPLELNALERSLTGGDNASFDPLELNALERSLGDGGGGGGGADVGALERSLTSSAGLFGAGDNSMGVQVLDLSGNVSFASWSFSVTLDPPGAPTFSASTALRNSRTASFDGVIPGLAATGGLPISVQLRVNGNASGFVEVTSEDGEFTFDNVNLSDGDNLITATAQDSAGNLSDRSETLAVVLDEVAPTVAIDPVAPEASSSFFTITGSISDNQPVDLGSVTLFANDDEIALGKAQGRFSQSVTLTDGSNTLRVVVQDAAGNEVESDTFTVTLDLAPPTTAPENITALPTADSRGIRLGWTEDVNAGSYNVYRSFVVFTDASDLTPVASSVSGTGYTDTTVLAGRMVYYAVASVDGAGNSDASVLSPVLPVALMKDAGGVASLDDGTSLRVPRSGLFANALLTATLEILTPSTTPDLGGAIDGTAREVVARTSTGAILQAFNLPAGLTHRVPFGVPVDADSPQTYQLVAQDWAGLDSVTNASLRTVTADVPGSGTYQLGEPASSATPWDVNGDNTVNIVDLVTVARSFGQTVAAGDPADTNGDGTVSIIDLVTVATHFGETTGPVGAPSLAAQDEPVVTLYTRLVGSAGGPDALEVVAESSVNLAGYEMVIDPGAGEIKSMTRGDVFGREVFWMDPAPVDGSTRIAAVRLDLASPAIPARKTGVLARLSVEGVVRDGEQMLRLRDVRFTDRKGALLPYRIGPPPSAQSFSTALLPNYPNPFNPETWIPFTLSEASEVTLRVYNVDGHVVRTLELGAREAGAYTSREGAAHWDGRNDLGEAAASGVYFYELSTGTTRNIRRMVIRK